MACKCKNINNVKELKDEIENVTKQKKLSFWAKCKIIWDFFFFYFIYVNTSIINFIVTGKLQPVFTKKLVKKYKLRINEQNLKN